MDQGEFSIIFPTVENCRDESSRAVPRIEEISMVDGPLHRWGDGSYAVATVPLRPTDLFSGLARPNIDSNVACGSLSRRR